MYLLQVGDVTATTELSLLPVEGPEFVRRIRGGMLNDAISCCFSALAGSMAMTTFAQVRGHSQRGCGAEVACRRHTPQGLTKFWPSALC